MIPVFVAGGLILGFGLFGLQTVKEAKHAEDLENSRQKKLRSRLRKLVGNYVVITLNNGVHKKGYLHEVRKRKFVLDTTKPKKVGDTWVCLDTEINKVNAETLLLESVARVDSVLTSDELTSYQF